MKKLTRWNYSYSLSFILGIALFSYFSSAAYGDHFLPENLPTMRTALSYTGGEGIGYSTGYTSYELFFTPFPKIWNNKQFFTDIRYHCFDHGKQALNAGVGGRCYFQTWDIILGLNVYYDYYGSKKPYSQMGIGFEYLADLFDLRVNVYIPVGDRSWKGDSHTFTYPDNCYRIRKERQDALAGFDTEIYTGGGKFIEMEEFDVYAALGGYYYRKKAGYPCSRDIIGGRLRLGASIADVISLEMSSTYDTVYKFGLQATFMITLPFSYKPAERLDAYKSYERYMARQRVYRNEIIVTNKKHWVRHAKVCPQISQ